MTLGKWHHRSGGKWYTFMDFRKFGVCYYYWRAEIPFTYDFMGEQKESAFVDYGYSPFAWLARLRAIAALKRMAGTDKH